MKYLKNSGKLIVNADKCVGCKLCVEVCPHGVFGINNGKAEIVKAAICMECGACEKNCPAGAIKAASGVGCAAAIYNSMFNRKNPECSCTLDDYNDSGCC